MALDILDVAIVVAYLLLLGLLGVRYDRGDLPFERLLLLLGGSLVWLSYGLLQLSQAGPIPTEGPLALALDALAVVTLVVGMYALYRWWRDRGTTGNAAAVADQ